MLGYEASRTQTIKTILNLIIFVSVLIIGTVILAAFARGYTFDPNTGEVIRYGLVQVESTPPNTQVVLNDELVGETTPWKESLNEGQHTIKLQRENFQTWQRTFEIEGGEVRNFTYPLLVPNQASFTAFRPLVSQQSPSFSPKQTFLLRRVSSDLVVQNLNVKNDSEQIPLPAAAEELNITQATWSKNEDETLLRFGSGADAAYYLLDLNSSELTNVTEEVGDYDINGLLSGTDTLAIATSNDKNIILINLETGGRTVLSQDASNAVWVNSTIVWFDKPEDRLLSYRDGKRIRIPTLSDVSADTRILVSEYNGVLNLAYKPNDRLSIIINALDAPFERRVEDIETLRSFSPNGQYMLYEKNGKLSTFDLKELESHNFNIAVDEFTDISWANGEHLTALRDGEEHITFDFDGENFQVITTRQAANTFLSSNLAYAYAITGESGSQSLLRLELAPDELL